MTTMLLALAAVAVTILSSGRLTRLVTQDKFPPAVWLRIKWDDRFDETEDKEASPWYPLLHCHWCLAPWITGVVGLAGYLSDWHEIWWGFNLWLACSYVASMIVDRDEAR